MMAEAGALESATINHLYLFRGIGRRFQETACSGLRRSAAGLLGAAFALMAAQASAATFDCVMDPSLTVKLGSPVTSVLAEVLVDRGDLVKKGQIIARVESAVEQAALATNEARAASTAEIEAKQALLDQKSGVYRRKVDLQSHNVTSAQDVETAQAEFNVAKQEVELARLNRQMAQLEIDRVRALLEQRTIRSPIDGVVVQRSLGPGEFVRQDANVVTVASIDPLSVEAYLPVRYFGLIKVGDLAIVHPDDPVGGDHQAAVSIVDQVFDAASGTFGVRLNLPNHDNLLPGGLRCHVTFDIPEKSARDVAASERTRR
jgi:RND family efflux transporter MFP subunit